MLLWTLLSVFGHKHHLHNATHHHESVRDIPCLNECPDKALNFKDSETVCMWWNVEGEQDENSCFEECSDRVMHHLEHKIEKACHEFVKKSEEHDHVYLENNSTRSDNRTHSHNTTHAQGHKQHQHQDHHNTIRNDTKSHEHEKHEHDLPKGHKQHQHEDHHNTTRNDTKSHEHEEHEHDMPKCLIDCPFEEVDFSKPESLCPWWHAEGPEHNPESCFNDCSPGVMHHVKHHVDQVCVGGPEENPFECAMDCPFEGVDPHSAESFCPWFSQTKNHTCFYDCSDDFMNMAQAHAEHTCAEFEVEGAAKFTNYIIEPIVTELEKIIPGKCPGGFYHVGDYECKVCPAAMYSFEGDYECTVCAKNMTSFPGASSPEECFIRH